MAATYNLMHPEIPNTPAIATVIDYWCVNGKSVGLELQFADMRRKLTFKEMRELGAVQVEAEQAHEVMEAV